MTCRQFIDFICDYLSGELDAPTRADFNGHLQACEACTRYLQSYEFTVQLGQCACRRDEELPADVPEDLVQAILAARDRNPDSTLN